MSTLLSELRRERNGAVADAMRFYGKGYGLNLGVSIPAIKQIAADFPQDHGFAEFLYRQDVRELKIAALRLAEPDRVTPDSFGFWASGIINSEMAEQAAMALLCKIGCADELLAAWCDDGGQNILTAYSAMLAVSRNGDAAPEKTLAAIEKLMEGIDDNRLIGQGIVAAVVSMHERAPERTASLTERIKQMNTPLAGYVAEELSWRI